MNICSLTVVCRSFVCYNVIIFLNLYSKATEGVWKFYVLSQWLAHCEFPHTLTRRGVIPVYRAILNYYSYKQNMGAWANAINYGPDSLSMGSYSIQSCTHGLWLSMWPTCDFKKYTDWTGRKQRGLKPTREALPECGTRFNKGLPHWGRSGKK